MKQGITLKKCDDCNGNVRVKESASVSIVIAARNNAEFLGEAIESALGQTVPCQVIYADDSSIDNSLDVARGYASRGLEILEAQDHGGVCAARNSGAAHARHDYLVFVDGDDILSADFVKRHLSAMRPGCPFTYCLAQAFGDLDLLWDTPEWDGGATLWCNNFVNTSAMWSRWAFEAAGKWRDGIKTMWDWDLALRGQRLGAPRRSQAVLRYRQHAGSWSANNREKTLRQQEIYMPQIRRLNARVSIGAVISGRLPELFPSWMSALAQSAHLIGAAAPPELVLLDNSGTESMRELIHAETDRYRRTFEAIHVIPFPEKLIWSNEAERMDAVAKLLAHAYNLLRMEMHGDIHWLVEDDVLVPLQGGNDLFTKLVSGYAPPNAVSGCYRNRHIPERLLGGWWKDGQPEELRQVPDAPIAVDFTGTGCLMYWASRTPAFWRSHLRDISAHDWEWCHRLKESGGRILLLPEVRCGHAVDVENILWP